MSIDPSTANDGDAVKTIPQDPSARAVGSDQGWHCPRCGFHNDSMGSLAAGTVECGAGSEGGCKQRIPVDHLA